MELLPTRTSFRPDERIALEVRGVDGPGTVELDRLGSVVARARVSPGNRILRLAPQPQGGYGLSLLLDAGASWQGAIDVLADPMSRPRYGFLTGFERGRDPGRVVEHARRFHLTAMQFYDWMYRHARLLPPADEFHDALGRELSLATVRRLVRALRSAGSLSLGYAAVYAVGSEEREHWHDALLSDGAGLPCTLGEDFLWIVDPADPRWLRHFSGDLRLAAERVGFDGFHLDQYGAPQRALRPDGAAVDLSQAFPKLLRHVRRALPNARLVFNNVNDFPTWTTASAPQDAVYIEVWEPHTTLGDLAELVARARRFAPEKPAILAAYLSCFRDAPERGALAAAQLVTATIASSGGFHLLHGEEGGVLTHPYYPDYHRVRAGAREQLRRWQSFVVRTGDLLFDPSAVDVTRSVTGGINEEIRVAGPVPISTRPEAGSVWVRVVAVPGGRVLHVIDLSSQENVLWDAAKSPLRRLRGLAVQVRRATRRLPVVFSAQPHDPRLRVVRVTADDRGYARFELPPLQGWAIVWLPEREP
jgi:dextranase